MAKVCRGGCGKEKPEGDFYPGKNFCKPCYIKKVQASGWNNPQKKKRARMQQMKTDADSLAYGCWV